MGRPDPTMTPPAGGAITRSVASEPVPSTWVERGILFALPTLAALGPLLPFAGSVFTFRAGTIALLAVVMFRRQPLHRKCGLRTSVWMLLLVSVLAAMILSAAHGVDTYAASELNSSFFGAILLVGVLLLRVDKKLITSLLLGWAAAVTITCGLAILEMRTGWRASNYFANRDVETVLTDPGLASTFGNPNDYAYFLLIAFLLLVASFAVVRSALVGLIVVAYLLAVAFFIQRTESTLGFLVLGIILLTLVLARFPLAIIIVSPAIAGVVLLVANAPGGVAGLLGLEPSALSLFDEGQTGAVRLNLLLNGANFTLETGFLGLGPGGYETRTAAGHSSDLSTSGILSPHSAVLEILSQYGIFVFTAVVAVVVALARIGWRSYRDARRGRGVRLAGLALVMFAFLSPLMTVMASSSLEPSYSWMSFASMITLGLWLVNNPTEIETAAPGLSDGASKMPSRR